MSNKKNNSKKKIVLTEEQIIQIEALSAFLTVDQVADYLRIGRTTFYRVLKRTPEAMERYKKGRAKLSMAVGNKLYEKAIVQGDNACLIFLAKAKCGFAETTRMEYAFLEEDTEGKKFTDFYKDLRGEGEDEEEGEED